MARGAAPDEAQKLHRKWLKHRAFMVELACNKEWLAKIELVSRGEEGERDGGSGGLEASRRGWRPQGYSCLAAPARRAGVEGPMEDRREERAHPFTLTGGELAEGVWPALQLQFLDNQCPPSGHVTAVCCWACYMCLLPGHREVFTCTCTSLPKS